MPGKCSDANIFIESSFFFRAGGLRFSRDFLAVVFVANSKFCLFLAFIKLKIEINTYINWCDFELLCFLFASRLKILTAFYRLCDKAPLVQHGELHIEHGFAPSHH